jgi:hypothetical protein
MIVSECLLANGRANFLSAPRAEKCRLGRDALIR